MKKLVAYSFVAAAAALLSLASPLKAGILTLDDGSPTYTPPANFSDNTLVANTIIVGGLIDITGTTTVMPAEGNTATIAVSGSYSAEVGEIFSVAYKFAADNNTGAPITYTLSGAVSGLPIPALAGTIEPGLHVYEGTAQQPTPASFPIAGNFLGELTLTFTSASPPPSNAPSVAAPGTLDLTVQQIDFKLDVLPASIQPPAQPQNISTRANVGTGDNALIGGIIITGNDTKQVVLRGIGPSLGGSNVSGVLDDPVLELFDIDGNLLATNDNWMDNSADDQTILTDNNLAPTEDAESALVANLDPGAYTAIVRGAGDTTGVALVEAYDLDNGTTDSKLANISTRGFVQTGDNVMIGGFILGGGGGGIAQVIVRGTGPSLANDDVSDVLADPFIEVFDQDGNSLASNDNWMDDPNMQTVVDQGLAPSDPNESALYEVLPVGAYTVILSGVGGTSGVGLVEAYDIDGTMALSQ
ncbi:MAG: hypothetical protein H0W66_01605 [Chthoniobacterales bacterium]|nr:hypothetical protein [Chthoniobacterales bacterium]